MVIVGSFCLRGIWHKSTVRLITAVNCEAEDLQVVQVECHVTLTESDSVLHHSWHKSECI